MRNARYGVWLLSAAVLTVTACSSGSEQQAQANPCDPRTVDVGNPCDPAASGHGEVAPIDPARIRQGNNALYVGAAEAELVSRGSELWSDVSLSETGEIACSTCHGTNYQRMQASFAMPYPHPVDMVVERTGIEQVNAAEMVQMCMVVPMGSEPLPWNSLELAALAAYVKDMQKAFKAPMAAGANPCNPGDAKQNPCGGP